MTITVAIADDQALVRAGLRMIIEATHDLRIVAEANNGLDAIDIARRVRPDVMLMDIRMPTIDGIEATKQITTVTDHPRILILTTFDLDDYVFGALRAGASGFLLKDVGPEQLTHAIRTIASGDSLLAPTVTTRLIEAVIEHQAKPPQPLPPEISNLTPRESQILKLLAQGLSNTEIADQLVLSVATIKTHVTGVLAKLGLRDRVQAVVLAYETGIANPRTRTDPPRL